MIVVYNGINEQRNFREVPQNQFQHPGQPPVNQQQFHSQNQPMPMNTNNANRNLYGNNALTPNSGISGSNFGANNQNPFNLNQNSNLNR